jgi:hypothetical protein
MGKRSFKKLMNWTHISFFIFVLSLASVFGVGGESMSNSEQITLSGEVLRACFVAYADFSEKIKQYSDTSSKLERHLSKIDNYDIRIDRRDNNYIIVFEPKPLENIYPKGGGAQYTINQIDFRVLKKNYFK